jgi:hypothetical protein
MAPALLPSWHASGIVTRLRYLPLKVTTLCAWRHQLNVSAAHGIKPGGGNWATGALAAYHQRIAAYGNAHERQCCLASTATT